MEKRQYQFLMFTYDWNNEVKLPCFRGVEQFLQTHSDVEIVIVEGIGRYGETEAEPESLRIFEVPDLRKFDGVVIQGNVAFSTAQKQRIVDQAAKLQKPVISLNDELENCIYVGTDNKTAMKQMVDHMIERHSCRRLAFVCGPEDNREAEERKEAFRTSCRAHGIPEYDCKRYPGSWATEDGELAAKRILDDAGGKNWKKELLPEAVICANDDLAVGVVRVLKNAGVSIPYDTKVTGFDHLLMSETSSPQITTVSRDYEEIARMGLEVLYERVTGGECGEHIYSPSRIVEGESCGCLDHQILTAHLLEHFSRMETNAKQYYVLRDQVGPSLEKAESFQEIMQIFEEYGSCLGTGTTYLVLNSEYYSDLPNAANIHHYGERMMLMGVSGDKKNTLQMSEDGQFYEEFCRHEILPESVRTDSSLHLMYPLCCENICIGYIVTEQVSESMGTHFGELIIKRMEYAIESVRKKQLLQLMYYHLNWDYSI